jgi:hypothetical protein
MAVSAHAYVRGNTLKFYEWLKSLERGRLPETYRVKRRIADSPLVSILLPFRDKPDLLRTCVSSILAKTCYTNFELIGIDNGSVGDDTHELMHELATQYERVRFVRLLPEELRLGPRARPIATRNRLRAEP